MKRNKVKTYLKDNYVRLVPALVIAVAAGGLGFTYLVQSFAAEQTVKITNTVQNLTLGGPPVDANTSAIASTARVGDRLQYSISVTNTSPKGMFGGNELPGVKVTDGIQSGVEYSANPSAKAISIDYGTIPAGQVITRKFEVRVLASASSTIMQNVACFTSTAQFFQQAQKGCDSAFTRVAGASTVTTTAKPKTVAKAPAATPVAAPAPTPPPAAANCTGATNATVKTGSAGADVTVPTSGATAVQVSYGLDSSNLDSKSKLTPATGDSTVVIVTNLKPGATYSYQVIRQCSDGEYKSSETSTFSTEKMHLNVVFQSDDNDPIEGISSTASCIDGSGGKSDSTGLIIFDGATAGDCKLSYTHEEKQCTTALPVPQPVLAGEKSAADPITLSYKVKACADQTPAEDPSNAAAKNATSSKLAIGLGILAAILAGLLIRSYLKHRGDGNGPSGMASGPGNDDGFVPPVDIPPAPDSNADAMSDYDNDTEVADIAADPYAEVPEDQVTTPADTAAEPQAPAPAGEQPIAQQAPDSPPPVAPEPTQSPAPTPESQKPGDDGSMKIEH